MPLQRTFFQVENPNRIGIVEKTARKCVDDLGEVFERFDWENRSMYADYLAQVFHYVNEVTRLLSYAAARCSRSEELLHKKMIEGISEEKDHEQMAVRDINALGLSIDDFAELEETSAYHQTLYFMIDREGPASLLGYFMPLEGLAAKKLTNHLDKIIECHSEAAAEFLIEHCRLDVGHFDEGLQFLEYLTPEQLRACELTLKFSTKLYIKMVEKIIARHSDEVFVPLTSTSTAVNAPSV